MRLSVENQKRRDDMIAARTQKSVRAEFDRRCEYNSADKPCWIHIVNSGINFTYFWYAEKKAIYRAYKKYSTIFNCCTEAERENAWKMIEELEETYGIIN